MNMANHQPTCSAGAFQFSAPCTRDLWAIIPPALVVFLLVIAALPIPLPSSVKRFSRKVTAPFVPAIGQDEGQAVYESEDLLPPEDGSTIHVQTSKEESAPKGRTFIFVAATAILTVGWLATGIHVALQLAKSGPSQYLVVQAALAVVATATWVYATVRLLRRPPVITSYSLLLIFFLGFLGAVLQLAGHLYDYTVLERALPRRQRLAFEVVNVALTTILLFLMQNLPIHLSDHINPSITPEDHTTVWRWWTWIWVYPLIRLGNTKQLSDEEVWELSPILRTKVASYIFARTPGSTLTRRIIKANSMDLILSVIIVYIGGILDFGEPFFMKLILDGFQNGQPRGHLFLLAFLFLICYIARGQTEVHQFWYGRRAGTRVQSQLSAAVYHKALRIRDQKGMVSKLKNEKPGNPSDKTGKKGEDAKDKTASTGADLGKIVNLMGIDIGRITSLTIMGSFIWVAPIQFILSCVFLYSLLGVSAFAGVIPMILLTPISRKVGNNITKIQRGTMQAKDKRMKVVDELFGSIKFVKWVAWENQWIDRVMAGRAVEMTWLKKGRNNSSALSLITGLVPLSVSAVSFCAYVLLGNKLDIATAFAALRLFDMLRMPMSVIPFAITTFASVKVALERLGNFFDEDEVPDDVCTFDADTLDDDTLFLENATFQWFQPKTASDSTGTSQSPVSKAGSETAAAPGTRAQVSPESTVVETEEASTSSAMPEDDEERVFELRDISVSFPEGKLTVVTGPTASGKTALLMALLGEMELRPGGIRSLPKNPLSIDANGLSNSIAYCAQLPWLQQMSIKDNILFGSPMYDERYQATLRACALLPDLARFEDSDETEVGAKGVSLSGGQKARVALARAVYSRAKYVLLDDPLSAVDSHTARFLYEELLTGPLMKHRTVILVTHHVDLVLEDCDYLINMSEGRIQMQGTTTELRAQGLLDEIRASVDAPAPVEGTDAPEASAEVDDEVKPAAEPKKARKLVEEEARSEGRVKWPIYRSYLKATGYWTWGIFLLGIGLTQLLNLGQRVWLTVWGDAYDEIHALILYSSTTAQTAPKYAPAEAGMFEQFFSLPLLNASSVAPPYGLPSADHHPLFYVGVYGAIGLASVAFSNGIRFMLWTSGLAGSNRLFKSMLENVTRATMRWYDVTPMGRILNRFGKDVDVVDRELIFDMFLTLTRIAETFANLLMIVVIIPSFLPGTVVLTALYLWSTVRYLNTTRDLKRLDSTTHSPILSSFTDLVEGVVTVRAFATGKSFLAGHFDRVDKNAKYKYFMFMLNRWFSWTCDVLSACSVFFSIVFVIIAYPNSPGIAGLVISSAMQFGRSIYMTCRGWAETELALNSVERIVEYVKDLPQEPVPIVESNRPPAYWPSSSPSESLVVVENLEIKYAPELPSVLSGVSFSLKAQERVGLLGRTGSGKSTLAMSLLRFVDPVQGSIVIDGIDIGKIGVHDLRSRLTFIPQDATLFAGTIRYNLDPFGDHTDAECLDVLRRVNLITDSVSHTPSASHAPSKAPSISGAGAEPSTSSVPSLAPSDSLTQVERDTSKVKITLDTSVSAGGHNFSSGQRQLLALARALLRRSTVVIMDEATSQIDMDTDAKIQTTIREEFKESLLITVAHRLRTIIDYDRLIVMEDGHIAEVGTPAELITKEGGIFRVMCQKSGMFEELESRALAVSGTAA